MKKTLHIFAMFFGLIIFVSGITLLIIAGNESRTLLLQEQEIQIETYGIYRDGFHMLNQIEEQRVVCLCVIIGITNIFLGLIIDLFVIIKIIFCKCKKQ